LGSAVKLELHHIAELGSLDHKVNAAFTRVALRLGVESHQLEEQPQHILVVVLQITEEFVRCVGEECAQALDELDGIAGTDVLNEITYLEL